MADRLPPAFAALEPWCAAWALPTTAARHRKRAGSSMAELQAFYDALTPRLEEALQYLDGFALDALPVPERGLLDLCLALADVSLAVEKYRVPLLHDARHSTIFEVDTSALG